MGNAPIQPAQSLDPLPIVPTWLAASQTVAGREDPEVAAFRSGAALALLQGALGRDDVPRALLRARLALGAAEAAMIAAGRRERAAALRDELALLRPGDRPGPGGAVFAAWQRAARGPLTPAGLAKLLPGAMAADLPGWLGTRASGSGGDDPVARAAAVLEAARAAHPRETAATLVLADAVLARALGWDRLLPLIGAGLGPRQRRLSGAALRLACHRAVAASGVTAIRTADDLARRAARLRALAPKLRARGAAPAVALFLSRDALAPALALAGPPGALMSDRAARRLCDRLVSLGAVRELTGRATSRLYGL